jgi:hypothetical protein
MLSYQEGGELMLLKPLMAIVSIRPARDSEVCLRSSCEALPRMRKRADNGVRSVNTRSTDSIHKGDAFIPDWTKVNVVVNIMQWVRR